MGEFARYTRFRMTMASVVGLWAALSAHGQGNRTVRDTEVGGIYVQNPATPWKDFGSFVGVMSQYSGDQFDPSALKAGYSRFHVFRPSDDTEWSYFPYSGLRNYEASEVAAGRPPLFVTATYNGKKRPVVWAWSLRLSNGVPTAASQDWEYAVNVGDDRFVKFWLNQYLRPVLWKSMYTTPNLWWGLDECAFMWNLYGVLDDNNQFIPGVPWDSPFPQDATAYANSVSTFFNRVKTLAPDVRLMPNLGSVDNAAQVATQLADAPGMVLEGFYERNPSAYSRNYSVPFFNSLATFGALGRPNVMRALIGSGDTVLNAFAQYEILKGPNFFFAPMNDDSTGTAVPPSQYAQMDADLGTPLALFQSAQVGPSIGYQIFWRIFDGGVVYLNWTGSTYTVTLPSDRVYYSTSGSVITQLTVGDGAGAYARTTPLPKAARPSISPRLAAPTQGPVPITISSGTAGATIFYTLDGTTPTTSSKQYTGPISLSNSATLNAIAVASGYANSTVTTALYTLTGTVPQVQFALASDNGVGGTVYPVLSLNAIPNAGAPVTVNYTATQSNGSTASGSVSFVPGDTMRYFAVQAPTQNGAVTSVAITGAVNAAIGSASKYAYTTGAISAPADPTATATATAAAIISPTPGGGLSGTSATFTWNQGTGVSQYSLQVGSTGIGSSNIFSLPCTGTSQTVSGLPSSGAVYVRLGSNLGTAAAPKWAYADYTYSVTVPPTPAAMVSPAPGSGLSGSSVTFTWSKGVGVSEYFLRIGTTGPGSYDLFSMPTGSTTSQLISGLGTSGTIYARLFSNLGTPTAVNWQYADYTYRVVSTITPARMISPLPGATTGLSAVFTWGGGAGISQYLLQVGTTGPGSYNVFSLEVGTSTSQLVNGIPATGGTLYVRLWSNAGTAAAPNWTYLDSTYQMSKAATMSSPTPGLISATTRTFTWNAGVGGSGYELYIGTVPGGCNLGDYKAGTALSVTVAALPTRSTIYVRLWTTIAGAATYNDYVYTTTR